jgi:hypothetical protein
MPPRSAIGGVVAYGSALGVRFGVWVMTFDEILDQAIAMLQRRGRLTYGALKRQFDIDDAYLEDLKNELVNGQQLAVDEDGAVLVWRNAAARPAAEEPLPSSAFASPSEAERRQLTVLFCDVVDSTEDFVRLHRAHGQLVGDATEPTLTGYRVTITCPCGVTFVRHVTAGEAAVDLAALTRRN